MIYMVLLMAGFNFMVTSDSPLDWVFPVANAPQSHGSQDLYPTLLVNQYHFHPNAVTVTQVVANLGAMAGGSIVGYLSEIFGRRLCIIVMCILGGALVYPYSFVSSHAVMATAFSNSSVSKVHLVLYQFT